jgi:acetyl esterase
MPPVAEVQAILDLVTQLDLAPVESLGPDEARARYKLSNAARQPTAPGTPAREDVIPGPAGDLRVRIYTPSHALADPAPVLVWYHGGGFVIGDLDTAEPTAMDLATLTGAVVVSVDYRLAPEHRFPAAAEDAYAALSWVAAHAHELGARPDRLAVGGDSAGGNLAAVAALMARDRGGAPVTFQLLVYPVVDVAQDTPSHRDNADGYLLTASLMRWFWECYLGPDGDGADPYASPARAGSLSGLPPALVVTAEYDPLRDEGEAYAAALSAAGVPTRVHRYDGQVHGFFANPAYGPLALRALDEAAAALRDAFRT